MPARDDAVHDVALWRMLCRVRPQRSCEEPSSSTCSKLRRDRHHREALRGGVLRERPDDPRDFGGTRTPSAHRRRPRGRDVATPSGASRPLAVRGEDAISPGELPRQGAPPPVLRACPVCGAPLVPPCSRGRRHRSSSPTRCSTSTRRPDADSHRRAGTAPRGLRAVGIKDSLRRPRSSHREVRERSARGHPRDRYQGEGARRDRDPRRQGLRPRNPLARAERITLPAASSSSRAQRARRGLPGSATTTAVSDATMRLPSSRRACRSLRWARSVPAHVEGPPPRPALRA